jgi:hypothetical protein
VAKTKNACDKVVTDRERDLSSATYYVDAAARAVVSESFGPKFSMKRSAFWRGSRNFAQN